MLPDRLLNPHHPTFVFLKKILWFKIKGMLVTISLSCLFVE